MLLRRLDPSLLGPIPLGLEPPRETVAPRRRVIRLHLVNGARLAAEPVASGELGVN